jgi:hypothetical protein
VRWIVAHRVSNRHAADAEDGDGGDGGNDHALPLRCLAMPTAVGPPAVSVPSSGHDAIIPRVTTIPRSRRADYATFHNEITAP